MAGTIIQNEQRLNVFGCGDLLFPLVHLTSDYSTTQSSTLTDRQLINATNTLESTIVFAAKMGWIPSTAPICEKLSCTGKDTSSYLRKKKKRKRNQSTRNFWCWNFRCCGCIRSIFVDTIFFNSTYGPSVILEILWKVSSRIPVSMIPRLIFGLNKSEYYSQIIFFRDVAGQIEDSDIIQMGGPDAVVEADGTQVIGKRKNGLGRMMSKEHVYVITERGQRKIRRLVVKDKTADVLQVFDKHLLPNTEIMVDPGTENNHFKNIDLITQLHEIPGPIHINFDNPFQNTQTVESSHSGIKMRLRIGRGLRRHHLQPQLDFEDFVYNRTDGSPQDIFKKLGDAATKYITTLDTQTIRSSNIPHVLEKDEVQCIEGLSLSKIKQLTSESIYRKAKRFEVKASTVISTQVLPQTNCINGFYRAVKIYKQQITWGVENSARDPFSLSTINVYCECKFYEKETKHTGKCCSHIIGQLRRAVYFSTLV